MGDKTNGQSAADFYLPTAEENARSVNESRSVSAVPLNQNELYPTSRPAGILSLERLTADKGTDNKICYPTSNAASSPVSSPVEDAKIEQLQIEAEFSQMLSQAQISREEFGIIVGYIRETNEINKELRKFGKPEIKLNDSDLEQRILASRPQQQKFPGTVDLRGYNIGVVPRTQIASEFIATGIKQFVTLLLENPGLLLSLFLDFLPIIGSIKGLIEAFTGKDLITGDEIPEWVRILNVVMVAIPHAKAAWKLSKFVSKTFQHTVRAAYKALAPIAFVAAVSYKTPVEAMRLLKTVAALDEAALKIALKEAQNTEEAVLTATKTQNLAVKELSRLIPPKELASVKKAANQKAAARMEEALAANSGRRSNLPDALPARVTAQGGKRSGRKPKLKPKGKTDLSKSGALKEMAGKIHSIERLKGQTVALIELLINGERTYGAATNSSRRWSRAQSNALKEAGIKKIESVGKEVVHAEINILAWITKLKKEGNKIQILRWGVSSGIAGHRICPACRVVIDSLGGVAEEFSTLGKTY